MGSIPGRGGHKREEYFEIIKELRYRCMFRWHLTVFFDKVLRQVSERATGRRVKLRDGNRRWQEIIQILCADDAVLMTDSGEALKHTINEFKMACERMRLKSNVSSKSKLLMVRRDQRAR